MYQSAILNRNLERVFHKNNYNADFIRRNIYRPTEADATNRNPTPVTTVTISYIKGTSETISRILQPYNIRVTHKPTTALRLLTLFAIHLKTKAPGREVIIVSGQMNKNLRCCKPYKKQEDWNNFSNKLENREGLL